MFSVKSKLAIGAGAGLTAGLVPLVFRHRWLTWGASKDEVAMKLPGDELLPDASLVTTRAITIAAPPDAVWPWLMQMGSGRGGAYSYDWIENLLGLDMHSADQILPEFQDLKAGDEIPMGRGRPAMRVQILDPERTLAVRTIDQDWVWIFALSPANGIPGDIVPEDELPADGARGGGTAANDCTRLISRNRIVTARLTPEARLFYRLVMEPGSLIMERKMLLGIKERAEHLPRVAV